jgi:hypothetical protein
MLLEKQPIVIEKNKTDLYELKPLFFYMNPTEQFNLASSDKWHLNKYKYFAMQFQLSGEILLCPPGSKMVQPTTSTISLSMSKENLIPDPNNVNLLAIQAKVGEILFIPLHWYYFISPNLKMKCLGIHDYITYFLP